MGCQILDGALGFIITEVSFSVELVKEWDEFYISKKTGIMYYFLILGRLKMASQN